ncbi:MAG TPA: TrmH family RNA methyltransferase [Acidimicrobiales bacterium]|nr:TrmH family RNA methyltransferase [Acidimicrobiales bacterium]
MMKQLGQTDLKRLHRDWAKRTSGRLALLLDGVSSPFNVGSIVRTAAAFRVDHLYLAGGASSPSSPRAGKTAMGTERYLSWSNFERGADAADAAREDGYSVIALELADQAVPLFQLSVGPDVCLAIGHEDRGLSPGALAACDAVAFIPQLGRVGSLNVATAAAIAIFELRRREWTGSWLQ